MSITDDQKKILKIAQRIDAIIDLKTSPPLVFAVHQIVLNGDRKEWPLSMSRKTQREVCEKVRRTVYQLIDKELLDKAGWGYYKLTPLGRWVTP